MLKTRVSLEVWSADEAEPEDRGASQLRLAGLGRAVSLASALARRDQVSLQSAVAVAWITEVTPFQGSGAFTVPPIPDAWLPSVAYDADDVEALAAWVVRVEAANLSHVEIAVARLLRALLPGRRGRRVADRRRDRLGRPARQPPKVHVPGDRRPDCSLRGRRRPPRRAPRGARRHLRQALAAGPRRRRRRRSRPAQPGDPGRTRGTRSDGHSSSAPASQAPTCICSSSSFSPRPTSVPSPSSTPSSRNSSSPQSGPNLKYSIPSTSDWTSTARSAPLPVFVRSTPSAPCWGKSQAVQIGSSSCSSSPKR